MFDHYFRKDIPEDYFSVKDNESSKKYRNLTTIKCKKKVRYDKVSSTTSSREEKKCYSYKGHGQVYYETNKKKNNDEENVFYDPNESTKLYHNECPEQGPDVEVLGSDELSVHQKILVPETEDVPCSPLQEDDNKPVADKGRIHPEVIVPDTEVYDYGLHCSIGAPSAASTPLGAANSPRFGYNNGDDSKEVSVGILDGVTGKSPSNDTVNLLTAAKSQLSHLPKSDSQFPVDLSYTQPQSPTIPSRTQSLNQDVNLTADCSVSLLPHGMRNEEVESRADYKIEQNTVKKSDDTVFVNKEANKKTDLQREGNVNNDPGKVSKQTTFDGKLSTSKANTVDKDNSGYKRKRKSSAEADDNMWPMESKHVSLRMMYNHLTLSCSPSSVASKRFFAGSPVFASPQNSILFFIYFIFLTTYLLIFNYSLFLFRVILFYSININIQVRWLNKPFVFLVALIQYQLNFF